VQEFSGPIQVDDVTAIVARCHWPSRGELAPFQPVIFANSSVMMSKRPAPII